MKRPPSTRPCARRPTPIMNCMCGCWKRSEEAGLAAGVQGSNISVVDYARQPVKPVAPDLPLYMAITLFVSLWLAVGGALLLESIHPSVNRAGLALLAVVLAGAVVHAQAPTPSTSGLPTGVVRVPAPQQIYKGAQSQRIASRLGHPRPKLACRRWLARSRPLRCPLPSRRETSSISASFTPRNSIPSFASLQRAP